MAVTVPAEKIGLHNPNSDRMENHFSPHCCRHWFMTHLRRAGMPRKFIQELQGDVRREAIDIYDHIDEKELREIYLIAEGSEDKRSEPVIGGIANIASKLYEDFSDIFPSKRNPLQRYTRLLV